MNPNLNEPAAAVPTQGSGPLAAASEYMVDAGFFFGTRSD